MSNIKVICDRDDLVAIADAVRSKTGSTSEMNLDGMVSGINSISGGGSAEIPTCTVRFIGGEGQASCYYRGTHYYTKCVDGVISLVSNNSDQDEQYFNYNFDNVVCGSIIYFGWSYGDADSGWAYITGDAIQLNDGNTTSESCLFRAPLTAGESCTIELIGETSDLGGI